MSSLDDELAEMFSNKQEDVKVEFPYFYVNLCKLTEPVTYKPLVDSSGTPFRAITGIRQGSITIDDENFSFRIPDKSNFKNLTEAQSKLVDSIHKELDIYCNANPDSWMFKPTKMTIISFASLVKLGNVQYNVYKPQIIIVNSARYIGSLKKFLGELTENYGKEYINNLYGRDYHFDKLLVTKAERKQDYGYMFNFSTTGEIEGDLPEEVLDRADNLNYEYIDVINFNEELYEKALKGLISINGSKV